MQPMNNINNPGGLDDLLKQAFLDLVEKNGKHFVGIADVVRLLRGLPGDVETRLQPLRRSPGVCAVGKAVRSRRLPQRLAEHAQPAERPLRFVAGGGADRAAQRDDVIQGRAQLRERRRPGFGHVDQRQGDRAQVAIGLGEDRGQPGDGRCWRRPVVRQRPERQMQHLLPSTAMNASFPFRVENRSCPVRIAPIHAQFVGGFRRCRSPQRGRCIA